ncbi:GDSL esterase/lipase At1g71691-like [Cicer arietinum]|uniref:GDSL esterase/lipase At1g71691-like n=1 Tax=Cicer arietinum TaxID=3827 RepID=A0A1S2Y7J7_CICAR|nr:GDSL esterase/lipase At1g71691-like [Cicer arietinum]
MFKFKVLWFISLITLQVLLANSYCTKSLVPALYVFGDSSVDAGNNNNLNTAAKANTFPYGIDFNNCSTGRFSNGKTFADIIAIKLGLPIPPSYLSVSEIERYQIASGINYASASCGILNSTRNGECLSLDKQIEYFTSTVTKDLPRNFRSKTKLKHYLSKSIYLLSIGSNDYILNYLRQEIGTNQDGNPEEYADYLLRQLGSNIKKIYDLGGRKFVIIGVGPIGCIPGYIIRKSHSQDCNEDVNQKVKPFSKKLPWMLQELKTQLSGSLFTILDSFKVFKKIRNSPEKFGFTNICDSCVGEGAKPCENRKQYYFYDFGHTTEATNEIYANKCFSGRHACVPLNVEQLVHAH